MRFCMLTTFYGSRSFGGDAAYVERLSGALARRGHEVQVVHCADAFEAVRGAQPLRPHEPVPGVKVHVLQSPWGILSPLATQVIGRPWFKRRELLKILDAAAPDVLHFHNLSLIGGPGLLGIGRGARRLMTAHEHWLICPMHLLWQYDRRSCESPDCLRCCVQGRRPPQVWRHTGFLEESLKNLDLLLFPSEDALRKHASRGFPVPLRQLPYFLPDDWSGGEEDRPREEGARPYLAAAGRLVRMKGFHRLIDVMRTLPGLDLRIAGTGPFEAELRARAAGADNIRFLGLCGRQEILRLFRSARAVVVPSLFPETFCYVALEAFSVRTPVVVHRGGGALREVGELSGGGLGYDTDAELRECIVRIVEDAALRDRLGERGYELRRTLWSEERHLDRYAGLVEEAGAFSKAVQTWSRT